MMSNLHEAAQQALEFIIATNKSSQFWLVPGSNLNKTVSDLRAALAEPQIDPVDEYRKGFIAGQIDMRDREQAEPVQEPVAWANMKDGEPVLLSTSQHPEDRANWMNPVPLYIHPPYLRAFTDQQIIAAKMMGYGEPGWDWDTQEQVDMFNDYLKETADLYDRLKHHQGYGYNEAEWEAFCYGWNAAKKHFGVKE